MAKEFDIYLNKRLTECDIIVYSIPYRDGLTAMNRLVLESCLDSYVLQKFIAVQTGSELISHIDEMIKTCYERLNCGVRLGASAEFQTHYTMYQDTSAIEIYAADTTMLATSFAAAESVLQINAQPLLAYIGKSPGRGSSELEFELELKNILKRSILKAYMPTNIDASVFRTSKQSFIQTNSSIVSAADLTNLCYRVNFAAEIAMQISASVLETEFHYSLGCGESSVAFDQILTGEQMEKFIAVNEALHILSGVTDTLIQFMKPGTNELTIYAEAIPILKRHRLLNEMDEESLLTYDTMTLEDIDYVIL
ncbi:hypothetical protein [Flavonifractor plautii]|uniref:hypothetical protein n=1 Tax=Flavonifractor plautii TaxID=292800 RepID=UPI0018A89B98|nr:hypothetical protein [Flavonifractor plautii]